MELLEQCQLWHEQEEHQKIADALEAIPAGERTPAMDLELARAYNNLADPEEPEGRALLEKAIRLMEPHGEAMGDDYSWNFRMGYACYYLDREGEALEYFQRALALHPGDSPQYNTRAELQGLIDDCLRWQAVRSGENLVLTREDVERLEELCQGPAGYFPRMLHDLEECIRAGEREGRFTLAQARADLEVALWYSYACNNMDEYEYYYRAAQWMPASQAAAEAVGSGAWYYRYSCALMYCGRLEEALTFARRGTELDPGYPWGYLQLAKLLCHFGHREEALEAVERGLALVPGDYEFTTIRREVLEGRTLEEMAYHWIDPECDRRLQAGEDEAEDKRRAVAHILCDEENLAAIRAALNPTEWEKDAPYCTFAIPWGGRTLSGCFFGNEAALSKQPALWFRELIRRLPQLERRGLAFLSAKAGLGVEGFRLERFSIQPDRGLNLFFQREEERQVVRFRPDFSLCPQEEQPALDAPEGGVFLAMVLLERPDWDEEQFKRDLRDLWGIPCMTRGDGEGEALVFETGGMTAAIQLYPFPVPQGEAEECASHNYLWPEGEEAVKNHQGQLLVSVLAGEQELLEAGRLQVKLVCAACQQAGVLGIYANGTVYQPAFYLGAAELMEDGGFPLLNLVWPGLYRREGGLCGYTDGLRSFGREELEVLDTQADPEDLRGFLLDIADYLLENDVTLQDGETIGFEEGQRLAITRSAGVWGGGMTLKIEYAPMEGE